LDAARELEKNGWAEKREDGKYYVTSAGQDAAKAAWHEIGSEMIHTMQGGN
jgi:Mn-dependent DtxR family transcriptional regulator